MLGLLFFACTGSLEITPFPSKLDFGEINFHETMPSDGYSAMEVDLTNTGEKEASLEVLAFDFEHLCLQGYTNAPASLSTLSPDSKFTLLVSVCDYIEEAGERDDLLSGSIEIDYGGDSLLSIPWSFTPILDIGGIEDSGG